MHQRLIDPAMVEAEIAHIRSLGIDALRRRWRAVFGRTPPAALSKDLLGRMIAFHMQERAFGGLDRESLRLLDGFARHTGLPRRHLKPGTVLVRDYQGERHTVTVTADGFDWQGTTYMSLSAIARAITGTGGQGRGRKSATRRMRCIMFTEAQKSALAAPLNGQHVKRRRQAGRSLAYIEGWKAIDEANRIFGFD